MDINKRISFDFDNTLNLEWVQTELFAPMSHFYEIVILTSRSPEKENLDLWELAKKLNISENKVFFTNYELKSDYVDKIGCVLHFDDDIVEIDDINCSCKCKGILVNYKKN